MLVLLCMHACHAHYEASPMVTLEMQRITATCKINQAFQRFSTALIQVYYWTPMEHSRDLRMILCQKYFLWEVCRGQGHCASGNFYISVIGLFFISTCWFMVVWLLCRLWEGSRILCRLHQDLVTVTRSRSHGHGHTVTGSKYNIESHGAYIHQGIRANHNQHFFIPCTCANNCPKADNK